ncbi:MAG: metallophosphoesterase family protein [Nitrososphaeria archaeon]|nr:metallophosphoesterase family protein [Nitrososphaeria archaeon]
MDIALIADIHSNLEAFEAVLEKIGGYKILCLGDLVGYGANPNEVIELVRDKNIKCIMGNHDYAVATGDFSELSPKAVIAAKWTRNVLKKENLDFLSTLPSTLRLEEEGKKILLAHATPQDPLFGDYIHPDTDPFKFLYYATEYEEDVLCLGHLHVPYIYRRLEKLILNPGSVGQPRDGNTLARYAILDTENMNVKVCGTKYNRELSAKKIIEANLPQIFAARLLKGV